MTLQHLLEGVPMTAIHGSLAVEIAGVAYDSRRVRRGDVFFALAGSTEDGTAYARQAAAAGAVAVVASAAEVPSVTVVHVPEPRVALARAAARLHGEPSLALRVVAVTGTNGKTTTTYLLEAVFRAAGWISGVIGTTGVHVGDERRPATLTTPESPELQGLLAEMSRRGVVAVALEISSHALVQRRGYGLHCDAMVFTNLSHDHLDYHGTLESYLDAKLMLFDGRNLPEPRKRAVALVNADDPVAGQVADAARRGGLEVARYSGEPDSRSAALVVHVTAIEPSAGGIELRVRTTKQPWLGSGGVSLAGGEEHRVRLPLLGRYNAANAAAAFASAWALGIDPETIARGLESMAGVPGRLERVDRGQPFLVVVDYAHTPDALARALAAVREHATGKVMLVFGCGGDRDPTKRPLMGRAAAAGSDRAWVTNDNPRSEDPARIAEEIVAGAPGAGLVVELDRRAAFHAALAEAEPGDVVLIAGKGHETTQTIGERVLPFDDRQVAGGWLDARREGR
ncbi:MAG TPA: UDP-N-acetylmuramoyl-L-alanyl-D-glutamate--2,6-diaminopimelate ligase [Candidatus Limnocylindria bacterium]|nr:UDP-N-acetylmuramoyl-L-alanyl-D-glutamate--2,6-diaminopimelate ligase [Candidatus Limnocylindria bacterium]